MARSTGDTTEIYRAVIRHAYAFEEFTSIYGPYDGPVGKSQAKRRIKDQHGNATIEGKVQKLEAVIDAIGIGIASLEWVDVDDSR